MQHPPIRGLSEWRPLGRGGLAMVWRARQPSLDRLVAVKVYQQKLGDNDRRRFLQEIAAVRRLSDHPGIVSVHDVGMLPDGRPYVIMEFCPGSLNQWLEPETRPSPEQVRQIGVAIADALALAHARGLLHRTLEPANILIDSSGNPGISDFGLAVAGAPSGYAPPETLRLQPATESGDVFSLGATLYALLTGGPPPRVGATAGHQPTELGRRLMALLMSAIAGDPASRPTAAELRDQLENMAAPAAADPAAYEAPPPQQSRSSRIAVLVLAAVLVAAVGSAMAWLMNESLSSGVPAAMAPTATTPDGVPFTAGPSVSSDPATPAPSVSWGEDTGSTPPARISLQDPPNSAAPFHAVQISGTFHGGPDRLLRVQRREDNRWRSFPIPAKTNQSGQFVTYVELGRPGRYRLRVVDPESGVKSRSFVLVIKR